MTGELVPILYVNTILGRIDNAAGKEKDAIDDYAELENDLRAKGLNAEADVVHEIRDDEIDHLQKFEAMRLRLLSNPLAQR